MRKGAAGSVRIPSSANGVSSTFADVTYSEAAGLPPRGFFVFRCRWDKRTINEEMKQEILKIEDFRHEKDGGTREKV